MMGEETKKVTAKDILSLLRQKYLDSREWVVASEVQRTTGASDRRYDFVALNCYASNNYKVEVVEIKVSKADLRRELEEPEKHNVLFDDIDYYSLAAPDKVIDLSITPKRWGVYAVVDGQLVTRRRPLALHDEPRKTLSRSFAASFLRAAKAQSLERSLLVDERQKGFDEGYARGKREFGQMADSWEQFKKLQDENFRLSNTLWALGVHGYPSEGAKSRLDHLKKCKEFVENLSSDDLNWAIGNFERKFKELREAMANLEALKKGHFADAPSSDFPTHQLVPSLLAASQHPAPHLFSERFSLLGRPPEAGGILGAKKS